MTQPLPPSQPAAPQPTKKKRKLWPWAVGGIVVIALATRLGSGSHGGKAANPSQPSFKIGDTMKTGEFQVVVSGVGVNQWFVGSSPFKSTPSTGAAYVIVDWKYKNITTRPIGAFSQPKVHLVDAAGAKYDKDIQASANYATDAKLTTKILSDLNPGIELQAGDVFEISKDAIAKPGWKVLVEADDDLEVPFAVAP